MSDDRPAPPADVWATVLGRPIRASYAPGQLKGTDGGPPRIPYWLIEINGTRYAGFAATVEDTEASVRAQLVRWAEAHPKAS